MPRASVRIALIDDDFWTRSAMVAALEHRSEIKVQLAVGQDEALLLPAEAWSEVDVCLVDICDVTAPAEIGTDLYSGISALEALRDARIPAIAIAPHEKSVLLAQRLFEAAPVAVYLRHEVATPEALLRIVLDPDPGRSPARPTALSLKAIGAEAAAANAAVHAYEKSPVHAALHEGLKLRQRRFSRRQIQKLNAEVHATGFEGPGPATASKHRLPRWPETRQYLLRLLGRA